MRPSIPLNDSYREVLSLQFRPEGIVVAHRGYAAQKVSYATPPQAHILRYGAMHRNQVRESVVDVLSPIDVAPIRWLAEPRIKRKLQMVVCIDQAGHEQKATQVDLCTFRIARRRQKRTGSDAANTVACDLYHRINRFPGPKRTTRSANQDLIDGLREMGCIIHASSSLDRYGSVMARVGGGSSRSMGGRPTRSRTTGNISST